MFVENFEPIAWAEELIEPARAVNHSRLAALYVMASQCYLAGRLEAAFRYSDAGQTVVGNDCDEVPFGIHGWLGSAYQFIGQPERAGRVVPRPTRARSRHSRIDQGRPAAFASVIDAVSARTSDGPN